jgi:hypothetical protein
MIPIQTVSFYIVLAHAVLAVVLSWAYVRRYQVKRPPVGVLNLVDVVVMLAGVVFVPYLYLDLPLWLGTLLLLSATSGIIYFVLEPMLHSRAALWLLAGALVAADVLALLVSGPASAIFFVVNNLVLLVTIIGVTALWAQSGMQARDAAILGTALAVYDFIFTVRMTFMSDLITRVAELPFAPVVAWPTTGGQWSGIGLGDLLMAAVFPLVMRKGFGRAAGRWTMAIVIAALTIVLALPIQSDFPVMVVLGPLMVLQYVYWHRALRIQSGGQGSRRASERGIDGVADGLEHHAAV